MIHTISTNVEKNNWKNSKLIHDLNKKVLINYKQMISLSLIGRLQKNYS